MSIAGIRMQRSELPGTTTPCSFPFKAPCPYRSADGTCDDPRTNKGNSDASCHKSANRMLAVYLKQPAP